MPPATAAWLGGDALNNGTIKEYLQRYSPQEWPEVTKLTLTYGIVALQHSYEGRILSLRELRQAVETSNTTLVVQRNVPQLQRQILQLQSQLDNVFDKLTPEVQSVGYGSACCFNCSLATACSASCSWLQLCHPVGQ
jgi:hypothetical protein